MRRLFIYLFTSVFIFLFLSILAPVKSVFAGTCGPNQAYSCSTTNGLGGGEVCPTGYTTTSDPACANPTNPANPHYCCEDTCSAMGGECQPGQSGSACQSGYIQMVGSTGYCSAVGGGSCCIPLFCKRDYGGNCIDPNDCNGGSEVEPSDCTGATTCCYSSASAPGACTNPTNITSCTPNPCCDGYTCYHHVPNPPADNTPEYYACVYTAATCINGHNPTSCNPNDNKSNHGCCTYFSCVVTNTAGSANSNTTYGCVSTLNYCNSSSNPPVPPSSCNPAVAAGLAQAGSCCAGQVCSSGGVTTGGTYSCYGGGTCGTNTDGTPQNPSPCAPNAAPGATGGCCSGYVCLQGGVTTGGEFYCESINDLTGRRIFPCPKPALLYTGTE